MDSSHQLLWQQMQKKQQLLCWNGVQPTSLLAPYSVKVWSAIYSSVCLKIGPKLTRKRCGAAFMKSEHQKCFNLSGNNFFKPPSLNPHLYFRCYGNQIWYEKRFKVVQWIEFNTSPVNPSPVNPSPLLRPFNTSLCSWLGNLSNN